MQTEINWPAALCATDRAEQSAAVSALRLVLLNGLRIALKNRNNLSEAHLEDFAQDSLLRILDQLDQFRGRSKFTTWAQAIAMNTALTELRKKRWQDVSFDALMENGGQLADSSVIADDVLGADEERIRLIAALRAAIENELTPKQRAAILGELRELPFDQISELLGINRNATYKLIHDARRALRKHLNQSGITGADIQNAFDS